MERLETPMLDPELIRTQKSLQIVYTPIHGVGGVIIKPMLKRLGFNIQAVAEQDASMAFPHRKVAEPGKRRGASSWH